MLTSPRSPISRANSSSSQPNNPLSIRLYKVLSANFDDDATKEAVETVAGLYAPGHSPLNAKGKQVQRESGQPRDENADDDEEDIAETRPNVGSKAAAPAFIESVPGEIAAKARRSLRRDVESKLAESSRRFLIAFSEVDKVCNF
jgi:conserved oligomeric Golgi complex subunit 6